MTGGKHSGEIHQFPPEWDLSAGYGRGLPRPSKPSPRKALDGNLCESWLIKAVRPLPHWLANVTDAPWQGRVPLPGERGKFRLGDGGWEIMTQPE